jgi:hypothetical protein
MDHLIQTKAHERMRLKFCDVTLRRKATQIEVVKKRDGSSRNVD